MAVGLFALSFLPLCDLQSSPLAFLPNFIHKTMRLY